MECSTILLLACHTTNDLKKRALQHNMKYFSEVASTVVVINSLECKDEMFEDVLRKSTDLSATTLLFAYFPNDKYLCQGKWMSYLKMINTTHYTNFILANDSFLITRSLCDYKKLIDPSVELVALLDSYQIAYHYPDFLRTYNKSGLEKILHLYKSTASTITEFQSIIDNYEVKGAELFSPVKILYKNKSQHLSNIHFDNTYLEDHLYNLQYPIIKLKKIQFTSIVFNTLPTDFVPSVYRSLNPDLSMFSDQDVTNHYIQNGTHEGRPYKQNQAIILPTFLQSYLDRIGFIFVK